MNDLAARLGQGAVAQPSLPLPPSQLEFEALVAEIKASAAVDAFCRKRATQILTHGHTPEQDLTRTPFELVREVKARLHAFENYAPPLRMNLLAGRAEQCIRYVEVAGGILLSLWDRCQIEVPE